MPERWSVEAEQRVAAELAASPPAFVGDGSRPVWSIDTPPPYPSGRWHIGAVAGYSLIDMIARSRRMLGFDVLFPWGTDRNGINIEFTVEKASGKPMRAWDRAEFNKACRDAISAYSDDMKRIGRRIGLSCDFDNGYETDSPAYRAFSQARFLELFEAGLIVEDLRPNTFDPKLGTTIADAEVFYEERKTRLNHVTWTARDPQTGQEEPITISTTRPELICACRAVLVHPDNVATRGLIGKVAVLPIDRTGAQATPAAGGGATGAGAPGTHVASGANGLGNEVPILAHPHVKADFGSGIMMVCSYGDQADVQLFRELDLEPIAAVGLDGRMTDVAGKYAGMRVDEARKAIIEDLEAAGRLPEHDVVDQKFPISERSKAAVEIISLKEWYVRQTHATGDLRRIAREMDFVPAKHRQLLLDWIDTVSIDWPISRRRYYHTEIPLWYVRWKPTDVAGTDAGGGAVDPVADWTDPETGRQHAFLVLVPPPGPYYQPWAEGPPDDATVMDRQTRETFGTWRAWRDQDARRWFAQATQGHPDSVPPGFKDKTWEDFRDARYEAVAETKVFDTWMDSSVSHMFILKDHRDQPWWGGHTCSLRINGRDIVRTWLYYACLKNLLLRGAKPFEHCVVHGMGVDKHGRKMSKSLGNVVDPDSIVERHGADAFRLWIAGECTIGDDFRIDEQKIQGTGKFLQKLANVVSFVGRFERPREQPALHPVDEWILGELDQVTREATAGYEALDLFGPANRVRSFVWNLFAPHYLEMVKGRAYGDAARGIAPDPAAGWTLHEVVRRVLLLLAPLAPFVTHHLGREAYGIDIHEERLPAPLGFDSDDGLTDTIVSFNSEVWKAKKDAGMSLAQPIEGIDVPQRLKPMADVLRSMHKLERQVEAE